MRMAFLRIQLSPYMSFVFEARIGDAVFLYYSPLAHSVTLTESPNSPTAEYHGVIEGESMQVRHCVDGKLSDEVIKLFKKK